MKTYIYGHVTQKEEDRYRARGLDERGSQLDYLGGIIRNELIKRGKTLSSDQLSEKVEWKFAERMLLTCEDIHAYVVSFQTTV